MLVGALPTALAGWEVQGEVGGLCPAARGWASTACSRGSALACQEAQALHRGALATNSNQGYLTLGLGKGLVRASRAPTLVRDSLQAAPVSLQRKETLSLVEVA